MKIFHRHLTISIILIVAVAGNSARSAGSAPQERDVSHPTNIANVDPEFFFRLIQLDVFSSDHFLEEVNILPAQRDKLRTCVEQGMKDLLQATGRSLDRRVDDSESHPIEADAAEVASTIEKVKLEFNSVLLPGQLKQIIALLRQRDLIRQHGCQSFDLIRMEEFPHMTPQTLPLKNSAELKRLSEQYSQRVLEARKQCWKQIQPELSPQLITDLERILPAVKNQSSVLRMSERLPDFAQLQKWTNDDFDTFEIHSFQNFVSASFNDPELAAQLGILDYQMEQITAILKQPLPLDKKMIAEKAEFQERKSQALADRNLDELQALFLVHQSLESRERELYYSRAADEVLLPEQVKHIKSIAKFKRLMIEQGSGDEFGVVLAWSKLVDNQDNPVDDELKKTVAEARQTFYEKRKLIWTEMSQKIWLEMTPESRESFQVHCGEFYDYDEEVHRNWNQVEIKSSMDKQQLPSKHGGNEGQGASAYGGAR